MASICVFCGSSSGADPRHGEAARALGAALAGGGHRLVYGGGSVGLMGIVADAVLGAGGEVTGVMTRQLAALEVGHGTLTTLEVTSSMHERKARMAELSDGVIALPGGYGTYEEVFEILTWNQLGLVRTPVVFLDVDGFYRPLMDFLAAASAAGFLRDAHRAIAQHASSIDDAVRLATAAPPEYVPKWIDTSA